MLKIFLLSLVVWKVSELTQNKKTKNLRFYDLKILGYKKLRKQKYKVLKNYLAYLNFMKWFLFLEFSSIGKWGGQLKTTKWEIWDLKV